MRLASILIAAASTVKASQWEKCEEIRKCDLANGEEGFTSDCWMSTAGQIMQTNSWTGNIQYTKIKQNPRYNTNSAIWLVMDNFDRVDVTDSCGNDWLNEQSNCWRTIRKGQNLFKIMQGVDFRTTQLWTAEIRWRAELDEDLGPMTAERFIICDADLHSFDVNEPKPIPPSGQWDKCEEIEPCGTRDHFQQPAGWTSTDLLYSRVACYNPSTLHGTIEIRQSEFEKTKRFNTNSALWIVVNEKFDTDTIADQCAINQEENCWRAIGKGEKLYKVMRGMDFRSTKLDTAVIKVAGAANRMIICDADQHSFNVNEPEPEKPNPTLKNTYCGNAIMWHHPNGLASKRWTLTTEKFTGLHYTIDDEKIYTDGDGNYLWWGWIAFNGRWSISKGAPGNAKETIAILDKRENYQYHCPYDLDASHWTFDPSGAYSGSFFKQDNCGKRIRPCQRWENAKDADCFVWETSVKNGIYSGRLTYPYLSQTQNYQARKSVWVAFDNRIPSSALTVENECERDQNDGCWSKNQYGDFSFQLQRGAQDFNAVLDVVDVTMHVDPALNSFSQPKRGEEYLSMDWVYLCEATFHTDPMYPQLEPEPPIYPSSGQWEKCVEIPECDAPWEPAGWTSTDQFFHRVACFEPRAMDGSGSIRIRQSEFEKTRRFNSNSAIWILGYEDEDKAFKSDTIVDQCEINQEEGCWRAIGKGERLYKVMRGMSYTTTKLDTAVIKVEGAAERMIICNADLHSFDVMEPNYGIDPPLKNKDCSTGIMWHDSDGKPSRRWTLSDEKFTDLPAYVDEEKIYVDGEGNYMWWMWVGFSGRWTIDSLWGGRESTNGFEAILEKHEEYQFNCPYDIGSSHWHENSLDVYEGSFFKRDNCEKRIRACRPWDDPENADCFVWETSYNEGTYSGRLTYPYLSKTQYHNARKSVWVAFDKEIARNDLTVDDECVAHQNRGCWQRNKNGAFSFQFTRGMDYFNSILDVVDITMHVDSAPVIGHEFLNMDWVYLCESSGGSEPYYPQPEPETPEPPTCALSSLDDVTMDVDDLIENHSMPKGKAKRVARFWQNNVIGQFKKQFGNIKNDQCKVIGQFLCHEMKPKSSSFRDTFDWALNLGVVRLGACGGFKVFEKKLVKWSQMVELSAPVLEYEDCPSSCQGDSFQQYLIPRIYQAIDNSYLTARNSWMNKFKYTYIKLISIVQNDVRNFPTCREAVGTDEFACMTICTLDTIGELTNWWGARLGDSGVGNHKECPNGGANDPQNRKPKLMRQMEGLQNWLCSVNPECKQRSIKNFWLPKWAYNL